MEVHLTERELAALAEGRIVMREGRAAGYEWEEGVRIVPLPHRSLERVLAAARQWEAETFPEATPESCARHLQREAGELIERPMEPHEWADAMMLVWCGAALAGVDLVQAIAEKLAINKGRTWGEPNAEGFREHVR